MERRRAADGRRHRVHDRTRSVEEDWFNHTIDHRQPDRHAPDPTTVVVTSSVPDPKLPILDMYIVPKHIYEKISAEDLVTYPADDNVSGAAFMHRRAARGRVRPAGEEPQLVRQQSRRSTS